VNVVRADALAGNTAHLTLDNMGNVIHQEMRGYTSLPTILGSIFCLSAAEERYYP
jgi:hypothetical protein